MPNPHDCETYDFPVKKGTLSYLFQLTVDQTLGGSWQIAVQDAIDKAKAKAEDAGEKAMKDETCKEPCERLIYVDVSIDKIEPKWVGPWKNVKGHLIRKLDIPITGIWQAGILCFKKGLSESK